jgi:hypothetical protein
MKLGLGIRTAAAAAALFAQLALPIAHGAGAAAESNAGFTSPAVAAASTSSTAAAHDPSACPICTALCQARAGIGRSLPAAPLLTAVLSALPIERAQALPGAPDLDTAAPRAPPVLALAFA